MTEVGEAQSPPTSTRFTSDTAREAGRRGAEARWRKEAERKAAQAGEGSDGVLAAPRGDAVVARAALMRIVEGKDSQDSAVVSAARTILEQAGALTVARPRTTTQLEVMTRAERQALIRTMELAHHLPDTRNPNGVQG